jgi:hypothetical protein
MDTQTSDQASEKGRLIPLSRHPVMDRLANILKGMSPDRQEAFGEWLEQSDTQHGEDVTRGEDNDSQCTD